MPNLQHFQHIGGEFREHVIKVNVAEAGWVIFLQVFEIVQIDADEMVFVRFKPTVSPTKPDAFLQGCVTDIVPIPHVAAGKGVQKHLDLIEVWDLIVARTILNREVEIHLQSEFIEFVQAEQDRVLMFRPASVPASPSPPTPCR